MADTSTVTPSNRLHRLSLGDDAATSQLQSFPLRKLPGELQLLILKHAATHSSPIDMSKTSSHILPDLIRVSKSFHDEGLKLYYRENTFLVPLDLELGRQEIICLDEWLLSGRNCTCMAKIGVQVGLVITVQENRIRYDVMRSSLSNLIQLATHFYDRRSEQARRIIEIQFVVLRFEASVDGSPDTTTSAAEQTIRQLTDAFWGLFDGSLKDFGSGRYVVNWADEEEMAMNHGIPLLERAAALGQICQELKDAFLKIWK